jgi:hypothetical protein
MMGFRRNRSPARPFPELLAAYADGELDAAGLAVVEAWLADHPEARADLDAQRALSRNNAPFWHQSRPAAPSEKSWSRLLNRVHLAVRNRSAAPLASPRRTLTFPSVAALVATAAAALLAVGLIRPIDDPSAPPPSADAEPPWPVAAAWEIDIQGIQEADTDLLVVGRPPLTGPVVLASAGEVHLDSVAKDTDGMMPPPMAPGPNSPMLVVPVAAAR